ncbi:MAG TPA: DUF3817 domain-containing protein [Flavipsychrobacter sp.]|nr:DUF3817 domain-containing protein [Flavipsychrobacter sp.]
MNSFTWFRRVAFWEGISYLVLLFVAMPLKYFADMPKAVSIVGGAHGALFVAFGGLAVWVMEEYKMKFKWLAIAMIASIIPFGTFVMEKYWKREQAEKSQEKTI